MRSEPYRKVKQKLIQAGYTPKVSDAVSVKLTNQLIDETGTQVRIPFKSKSEGTQSALTTGFFEEARDNIRVSGNVPEQNQDYPIEHYSSQQIVDQADGVLTWQYVDYSELDKYVEPDESVQSGGVTTAVNIPIPGYSFQGTYSLSDICYVVSGSCFGLFLLSLADLIPGDEAFVGTGCGILGGGCWIADTAARYTSCSNPKIKLYKRSWWNPLGPIYIGYPVC